MKDNLQNIADLIGALAEDIEAIKEKLDAKDSPDKSEALKRLEAKLEPVIQFFNAMHRKMSMSFSEARKPSRNTSNQ